MAEVKKQKKMPRKKATKRQKMDWFAAYVFIAPVTIGLFAGLGFWNDWTNGLYYVNRSNMFTIQVLLNRMIQDIQALANNSNASGQAVLNLPTVSIRMAIAFVAILPILIVYPFLQKYFASGIALGAVKG